MASTKSSPSFLASLLPISLEEQERFSSGLNAATPFGEGEYLLSSEGMHVYVGKLALRQGSKATDARGAANRYWTEHNRNLLRASIPRPVFLSRNLSRTARTIRAPMPTSLKSALLLDCQ